MKKVSIVYWSGTGNTKLIADSVAESAKQSGADVTIVEVDNASVNDVLKADVIALGCPAMGNEVLEEDSMEPFVEALLSENISGKPFALFGSYDWGDGQWMREWEDRMKSCGANLIADGLIIQNTPDDEGLELCHSLGKIISGI